MPRAAARSFRILFRLAIFVGLFLLALLAADRTIEHFDWFGVNHPERNRRWREEMWQLTFQKPDGSLDLDGTLFVQIPDKKLDLGAFEIRSNALGFRSPDVGLPKPENVYRILLLGDSVAFGWGVDEEITFVRRWEGELNARDDGLRYEVVNTSLPLYDSMQQAAIFDQFVGVLDPDAVVLVYVVNDIDPTRHLAEEFLGTRSPVPPGPKTALDSLSDRMRPWYPSLADVVGIWANSDRDWEEVLGTTQGEYVPEEVGKGPEGWARSKAALTRIQQGCQQRGLPFVLLDHSFPPIKALPGFCADQGIPYRELRFSDEELGMEIYNSPMDAHSNRLGHDLLLGYMRTAMQELDLPPER